MSIHINTGYILISWDVLRLKDLTSVTKQGIPVGYRNPWGRPLDEWKLSANEEVERSMFSFSCKTGKRPWSWFKSQRMN